MQMYVIIFLIHIPTLTVGHIITVIPSWSNVDIPIPGVNGEVQNPPVALGLFVRKPTQNRYMCWRVHQHCWLDNWL